MSHLLKCNEVFRELVLYILFVVKSVSVKPTGFSLLKKRAIAHYVCNTFVEYFIKVTGTRSNKGSIFRKKKLV